MFGDFFGLPMRMSNGPFIEQFRCYSFSFLQNKEDKENGDKIILPISAFEKLAGMRVQYPMQFELRNENVEPVRRTHVGVLEFTAPEGQMYVPWWIMQNLLVEEGDVVTVRNVSLELARFVKFRPLSADFLEISDPKAVLESTLRNFSCLTKDDQIRINYNDKNYFLEVVDLKPVTPENAVSIVEADVNVDFDAAKTESTTPPAVLGEGQVLGGESKNGVTSTMADLARAREERRKQLEAQKAAYVPFSGTGRRVDDKPLKATGADAAPSSSTARLSPAPMSAASLTQGKWKSKTKALAFQGEGKSLSG